MSFIMTQFLQKFFLLFLVTSINQNFKASDQRSDGGWFSYNPYIYDPINYHPLITNKDMVLPKLQSQNDGAHDPSSNHPRMLNGFSPNMQLFNQIHRKLNDWRSNNNQRRLSDDQVVEIMAEIKQLPPLHIGAIDPFTGQSILHKLVMNHRAKEVQELFIDPRINIDITTTSPDSHPGTKPFEILLWVIIGSCYGKNIATYTQEFIALILSNRRYNIDNNPKLQKIICKWPTLRELFFDHGQELT